MLSDAVAVTVAVPLTVVLLAGAVTETVGAVVSAVLFMVIATVDDCATFPATS